jgi:DNA-binding CsgD family transcriptional regulator
MPGGTARALVAIYDAALSDEYWPRALDEFANEISAIGAIVVAVDQVGLPFRIEQAPTRYGIERTRYYFENFGHFDEPVMSRRLAVTPPGRLLRDCDVWGDMSKLEERPDYRWMREQIGARRRAGLRLSENKGWMDLLALQFDRDWPELDAIVPAQLDVLVPHLAKVVEINRKFSILRQRYRATLTALDHIRIGTCVVGATGHVLVSNLEAQRIFELKDGVGVAKTGFLTLGTGDATGMLACKLKAVTSTAGGEGRDPEVIVFAERHSGPRPFLIEIAPLRDSVDELERGLAGAIVFIIDPENHRALSIERLVRLFALTEAEAQVCRRMVEGHSARDIADMRSVAEETVKSQFKAVYGKTGTRRRAELIRLAVTIDPPIESPATAR